MIIRPSVTGHEVYISAFVAMDHCYLLQQQRFGVTCSVDCNKAFTLLLWLRLEHTAMLTRVSLVCSALSW